MGRFDQHLAELFPISAFVSQHRPKLRRLRPIWGRFRPSLADIDQSCSMSSPALIDVLSSSTPFCVTRGGGTMITRERFLADVAKVGQVSAFEAPRSVIGTSIGRGRQGARPRSGFQLWPLSLDVRGGGIRAGSARARTAQGRYACGAACWRRGATRKGRGLAGKTWVPQWGSDAVRREHVMAC